MTIKPVPPLFWIVVSHRYARMFRGVAAASRQMRATATGTWKLPVSVSEQYISRCTVSGFTVWLTVSKPIANTTADPAPPAGAYEILNEFSSGARSICDTVKAAAVAADADADGYVLAPVAPGTVTDTGVPGVHWSGGSWRS